MLADTILPGSSHHFIDRHRPALAPPVAPHPEIHLVQSAAVPAILLGICKCRPIDSAVLEFVWNNLMRVAVDEAGDEGGSLQYICHVTDVQAGQTRVTGSVV